MNKKTKNILTVAAIIVVSYTVGKCNGISKLGKVIDKKLKKNYKLRIEKVCYDFMTNRVEVDIASTEKGE